MKIHNMELSKRESFLTNAFLKTPIFSATRSNELIEINYEMFNYNVNITGKQLNNDKDLDLFLWIIQQNKLEIDTTFKELLSDLGIINKEVRINKQKKITVINALNKLCTTNISISNNDYDLGSSFSIIDNFDYFEDNIVIKINDKLSKLYSSEKFNRIIKLEDIDNLNQNDRALFLFICSYRSKEVYIKIDKLKERIGKNKTNKKYKQDLTISLNNLKDDKKIGSFYLRNDGVLYINKNILSKKDCEKMAKDYARENGFNEKYDPLFHG